MGLWQQVGLTVAGVRGEKLVSRMRTLDLFCSSNVGTAY